MDIIKQNKQVLIDNPQIAVDLNKEAFKKWIKGRPVNVSNPPIFPRGSYSTAHVLEYMRWLQNFSLKPYQTEFVKMLFMETEMTFNTVSTMEPEIEDTKTRDKRNKQNFHNSLNKRYGRNNRGYNKNFK